MRLLSTILSRIHHRLGYTVRQYLAALLGVWTGVYAASGYYQSHKALPDGIAYQSPMLAAEVQFFADQSFIDIHGQKHTEQQIFAQVLKMIAEAKSTIVLDMFLFNAEVGQSKRIHQPLSQQLTDALLAKKRNNPAIEIKVITDPINTVYGGLQPAHFRQLQRHGIDLIVTDLRPLRASNPIWSGFWYMCCQRVGNNPQGGWLPSPFGADKITLRSYLELLNFKANHRKILITDSPKGWQTLISSANPHDGSDRHSNVALLVKGGFAQYALQSEHAVAQMSGGNIPLLAIAAPPPNPSLPSVQLLTEGMIESQVRTAIDALQQGEQLDLMMFYLSHRSIIKAIKAAQVRGVRIRVLLDPNKDAFGRQKDGIPNRPVAQELHEAGIPVRWCLTQGEQCHSKLLILSKKNGSRHVVLGSANYTARNLDNYNLETDMYVIGRTDYPALAQTQQFFDRAWSNDPQRIVSVDYSQYADNSRWHYWRYRLMEWSGLSTF